MPINCLQVLLVSKFYGQATKGTRWMPWRVKAMKDVASCVKLRWGASNLWPEDFRMGEPGCFQQSLSTEFIGWWEQTQGSEPSQYLKEKKTIVIPLVAASEHGRAQTKELALWGCGTEYMKVTNLTVSRNGMERPSKERYRRVSENWSDFRSAPE